MKLNRSLFLILVFGLGTLGAGSALYTKIKTEEQLQLEIKAQEQEIKQKLTFYSSVQKVYFSQTADFIPDWNQFRAFVDTGVIIITQRNEEVKELYFGKDTSIVSYDTLKVISIKDSLLSKTDYELRTLEFVPDDLKARTFELYTGFSKGRKVFEIRDSDPINPKRLSGELDTLRVGSKFEPTTEGNWR